MKLVTFEVQGCVRVGAVEGDRVIDFSETSLPATTILSTCESSKGLKSAVIEGPTSGDSVSLG